MGVVFLSLGLGFLGSSSDFSDFCDGGITALNAKYGHQSPMFTFSFDLKQLYACRKVKIKLTMAINWGNFDHEIF